MSILSKAKSVVSGVIGGVKAAASAVKNVFSNLGSSQSANALNYNNPANNALQAARSVNQSIAPNMSTPAGPAYKDAQGNLIVVGTNGQPNLAATVVANTPTTISSKSSGVSGSWAPSSGPTGSPTVQNSPITINPKMSSTNLSSSSSPSASASDVGGGGSSPSISLPSSPGYSNPGTIDNSGLKNSLTDSHTYDPATNTFVAIPQQQDSALVTAANERKKTLDYLKELLPQKKNIYDSPEVKAQQAEVLARQKQVNDYTSQLNSVVAKQNADLLQLRDVGSKEGVTEVVYGGQQAQINREAAIKALPLQAQIATAQGNLGLAQEYLGQITKIVSENIDNAYDYKKGLYTAIADSVKGEDKIKLEALNKAADHAYATVTDNKNFAQSLMSKAFDDGNGALANQIGGLIAKVDRMDPVLFMKELNAIASKVQPKAVAADKPAQTGQTLVTSEDSAKDLETSGITTSDIVSLQKYLSQGYSLEQVAKMTSMPAAIQAAFSKYISVPKLGSGLNQ